VLHCFFSTVVNFKKQQQTKKTCNQAMNKAFSLTTKMSSRIVER